MKLLSTIAAAAVVASIASSASAFEFVQNGEFTNNTYGVSSQFGGQSGGSYTASQGVTGWTGAGGTALEFLYIGGTQTTVSPINRFDDPHAYFYPTLNTLSDSVGGEGGNFIGLDGDQDPKVGVQGGISQVINGLVVGESYTLTFNWGAAQLANRKGDTTDSLQIQFGTDVVSTPVLGIPSGGFSGWQHAQYQFTAASTSQTLSFLAVGTPFGLPPMAVLDSVSLTAVPEPTTWAMMLLGFGGIGAMIRRRRQTLATA